jgi:hypothetical protein
VATDRIPCPLCKGEGKLDTEEIKWESFFFIYVGLLLEYF